MNNVNFLFLYPPEQTWPGMVCKPNGSLAYPYLVGALRDVGIDSSIFDACVGNDRDDLDSFFFKPKKLASGMLQTGVSDERILQEVSNYDAVGITSIFSQQETQVLRCARLIKKHFPTYYLSAVVLTQEQEKIYFSKLDST